MELLLLPGGAAAAGVPVVVLAARARASGAVGARRPLPRLLARLGQPRLARRTSTCRSTTTAQVGVVEHVFADDAGGTLEEFRAELYSAAFDARRLALE